jgi:hypothetical protein
MATSLTNQYLRTAFIDQMAASRMPVERLPGGHGANQLYRITAGKLAGKTVRLRTNVGYCVMSLAEGPHHDAPIPSLVDVDFGGAACVNNRSGEVECYLIPAARLDADFKAGHRKHTEGLGRPSGSKVRILYFREQKNNREWCGYAKKYAEFRLQVTEPVSLKSASPKGGNDVVERARRMIAEEFGVPADAVKISVDLVADKLIAHA